MFVCQLSYSLNNVSLGHVGPLIENFSPDFSGFYRCLWVVGEGRGVSL